MNALKLKTENERYMVEVSGPILNCVRQAIELAKARKTMPHDEFIRAGEDLRTLHSQIGFHIREAIEDCPF